MRRTLTVLIAATLAFAACGNDDSDLVGGGQPGPGDDDTADSPAPGDFPIPDGVRTLVRLDSHDGVIDGLQVIIAADELAAQDLWDQHVPEDLPPGEGPGDPDTEGQYGSLDDVDFDSETLVLVAWGGSSSCPPWVADITTDGERLAVDFDRTPAEACTDDFASFRLLLAVDRGHLPTPDGTPITRIDVPSENLTDVHGEVTFHFGADPADDADIDEEPDMDEPSFDRTERTAAAEALLGVPEDEVDENPMQRIVRRGGEHFNVTMDLRPGRMNIELDDDGSGTYIVTRVVVEVPEDEDPLIVE